MILQNYYEDIKLLFPNVEQTTIVKDLNNAQKLFATETGILEARGELTSISTNVIWTLPSDFRELTDITFYDSDGNPVYMGEKNLTYDIEFGKIFIYSLTSTPITGLPDGIDKAYIHYKKIPTTLTGIGIALEIEQEFRDALFHKVLEKYFSMYPQKTLARDGTPVMARDWNAVKYHQGKYEEFKIKAKRYVNSKELSFGEVINYQHAGKTELPRRVNDSTYSSISVTQLTALGALYAKYALFNFTSAEGTKAATLKTGYTTISGSLTGSTLTITSTNEFGNDTQILCNNGEVTWTQDSDSQITVTLPGLFTLISMEIYERL